MSCSIPCQPSVLSKAMANDFPLGPVTPFHPCEPECKILQQIPLQLSNPLSKFGFTRTLPSRSSSPSSLDEHTCKVDTTKYFCKSIYDAKSKYKTRSEMLIISFSRQHHYNPVAYKLLFSGSQRDVWVSLPSAAAAHDNYQHVVWPDL